jgi:Na+-translocating ferredoxin:NAD+ oxidoreductase subunit B
MLLSYTRQQRSTEAATMKSATDVYRKLASHLDNLPGGFPSAESGVELRILRRLFSPHEAELALHVSLLPETAPVLARRAGITLDDATRRLAEMARKGLIYELAPEKGAMTYAAAQFVIGIWELHVNALDPELIRDFDEYLPTLAREALKFPQLRTIPVNRSLDARLIVMPYESAEALVRKATKILVAPCICRRERHLAGEACRAPEEACLLFDMGAEIYERNGLGRLIGHEEALAILARAEEAALVLQPGNSQEPMNICCCCGCCCGVLRSIKSHPNPATLTSSPFVASFSPEECSVCGDCLDRCQMGALRLDAGAIDLDEGRCIGCGLCVSKCPTGSLTLTRKPVSAQSKVPKNGIAAAMQLGKARGKLGPADLALMMVKSKLDRLRVLLQ